MTATPRPRCIGSMTCIALAAACGPLLAQPDARQPFADLPQLLARAGLPAAEAALLALADGPPAADAALLAQAAMAEPMPSPLGRDTLGFMAGELGQARVVKGAPYCADAVHESVQVLPDASGSPGNRIVRKHNTRLCRDGEGRTRQESERSGRRLVYLRDPVARENWVLDVERKTAHRLHVGTASLHFDGAFDRGVDSAAWRDYAERMRAWAQQFSRSLGGPGPAASAPPSPPRPPLPTAPSTSGPPPTPPVPPAPAVISRLGGDSRTIEFRVSRADAGQLPALPGLAGPGAPATVRWHAMSMAPRGPSVDTALGSKDIDGLRADGVRSTWTIEAGKIGNERPIEIVREVWTSPELMLTLSSHDFDPRSGEVKYRLQNLRRGEPDPALMKVPPDYSSPRSPAPPRRASAPQG